MLMLTGWVYPNFEIHSSIHAPKCKVQTLKRSLQQPQSIDEQEQPSTTSIRSAINRRTRSTYVQPSIDQHTFSHQPQSIDEQEQPSKTIIRSAIRFDCLELKILRKKCIWELEC
uniref:Uncharacterized protein n=1 Tax=Helianthus annuus TaxID=4232 RepID=A0A251UAZ8_HELAN